MASNLLSSTNRVQSPFIIVEIAGYEFGVYDKRTTNVIDDTGYYKKVLSKYPNYINSLTVKKINGQVNTYTLQMVYAITQYDDPNFLEKVFSAASKTRKIKISYGDFKNPTFIYSEEEALITKITSSVDVASSKITYTLTCQSSSILMQAGIQDFPYRKEKPSTIIKELLLDKRTGLQDIFQGMRDPTDELLAKLIKQDDQPVEIQAKTSTNIMDYLKYLVSCMISQSNADVNNFISNSKYMLAVYDDYRGEYGGTYFKVISVTGDTPRQSSLDTYELTIGFPEADMVTNFQINNNDTYSIFYEYAGKPQQ